MAFRTTVRLCVVVFCGLAGLGPAWAAPAGPADAEVCDHLASAPYDTARQAEGICAADVVADLALESCRRAVSYEPENARLRFQLGRLELLTQQPDEGLESLSQAAAAGYPAAMVALTLHHRAEGDDQAAFHWAMEAARLNNPVGQLMVGDAYHFGRGVAKDRAQAVQWFQAAVKHGEPISKYRISVFHQSSDLVEKNPRRSRQLLLEAAESGVASAQYMLGEQYFDPRGSEDQLAKARTWFSRAAESGHPLGRVVFGMFLRTGLGGPMDLQRAFEQLHLSALSGNVSGQYQLSLYYEKGTGVPSSIEDAYLWALIAAQQGDWLAQLRSTMLAGKLTSDQTAKLNAEAQKLAESIKNAEKPAADYCYELGN